MVILVGRVEIMALCVIYILSFWYILDFQYLSSKKSQNSHCYSDKRLLHSYPDYHWYGSIPVPTRVRFRLHTVTFIKELAIYADNFRGHNQKYIFRWLIIWIVYIGLSPKLTQLFMFGVIQIILNTTSLIY